jgi:hypothetical protein
MGSEASVRCVVGSMPCSFGGLNLEDSHASATVLGSEKKMIIIIASVGSQRWCVAFAVSRTMICAPNDQRRADN